MFINILILKAIYSTQTQKGFLLSPAYKCLKGIFAYFTLFKSFCGSCYNAQFKLYATSKMELMADNLLTVVR